MKFTMRMRYAQNDDDDDITGSAMKEISVVYDNLLDNYEYVNANRDDDDIVERR